MSTHSPHPDDETLFDLIEGNLPESRAREIEAHLDTCAVCGAIVRAALDGSPDEVTPVTPMPADAVASMDAALSAAWRERTAAIAAAEASTDPADTAIIDSTPLVPKAPDATNAGEQPAADAPVRTRRTRGGWGRRLVPIIALCVLGALAGTSIWLGAGAGGGDRSTSTDSAEVMADAPVTASPEAARTDGHALDSDGTVGGATADGATPPPSSGYAAQDVTCIGTLDPTRLYLPDGRVPTEVLQGPLGLYFICG